MIKLEDEYKSALKNYKFIDLFCGIGGFHLALSSFGAECVFASDIDASACEVYKNNFNIEPEGDIKKVEIKNKIPAHDILCAGFPCQAFSISGNQEGFKDKKSGKLFDEIMDIVNIHKPKLILLENVANLEKHNKGKTIKTIKEELIKKGYTSHQKILNSSDYNVPQCRNRIYIVAFRNNIYNKKYNFPDKVERTQKLSDLRDSHTGVIKKCIIKRKYKIRKNYKEIEKNCKKPYIRIGEIGEGRQGERIYSEKGCSTTLSSSSGGLGGRTGMYYINNKCRKLTPRECARLMGFPDNFIISKSNNQAYKQFGNSVVIDVLQYIVINIISCIRKEK